MTKYGKMMKYGNNKTVENKNIFGIVIMDYVHNISATSYSETVV